MIPETALKLYLPLFILAYLFIAFALPSYRVYKKTGINPLTFGATDSAHDFIGRWMKLLIAMLAVTVIIYSFCNQFYNYLLPIGYLNIVVCKSVGMVLIHLSLIWILIAQYQMSNAWRIGIDEKNKSVLVTAGLFRISRNPVFVGMLVSLLGIFLILPNIITCLVVITNYILIQIQIRLEEDFLAKQHGKAYEMYKANVRRII